MFQSVAKKTEYNNTVHVLVSI